MKRAFLILFFGLSITQVYAQNKKTLDSLNLVYQKASHDTTRILALVEIASEYRLTKKDSALILARQALQMSEKIQYKKGMASSLHNIGLVYFNQSNYPLALESYQKSLKIREEMGDKKGMASSLNNIGLTYFNQSNYPLALESYQKSLKIREEVGDKKGVANTLNGIGVVYKDQGSYPLALDLYQKSLKIREEVGDKAGVAINMNNIGTIYESQSNYALALEYYQKSLKFKEELGDKGGIGNSLNNIGVIYYQQGNYPLALESYQKSLKTREELGDKGGIASSLNNIGFIYQKQENYPLALESYQKSLKIREELGNKRGIAISLNSIANVYIYQGNYTLALDYHQKSLKIREEIGDKAGISLSLDNIGIICNKQENFPLALDYLQKSLKLKEELGDKAGMANSLNILAEIYQKQGDYEKAISYAQKGLAIAQEIKILPEIKNASQTLYESYKLKEDYTQALRYLELTKETHDSLFTVEKSKSIANLESKMALEKKEKEMLLLEKDNELNRIEAEKQKNARLITEKQAESEHLLALARAEKDKRKQDSLFNLAEKAQLETENLKAQEEKNRLEQEKKELAYQAETDRQRQFRNTFLVLSAALLVIVGLVGIGFWQKRQANKALKNSMAIIAKQSSEIAGQNKDLQQYNEELHQTQEELGLTLEMVSQQRDDIISSINYALRIQNAILPKEADLQKYLDCFVLFCPRDIVSGDFYWFAEKNNQQILAVADCTGHGVSGAFMTMIGNNMLNQIIHDWEIHEPNEILNKIPILLAKTLLHSEEQLKDGMDMAVLTFEKNMEENRITKIMYAGAMNPLYYVQNQEFIEIKADKVPISSKIGEDFHYQKHELLRPLEDAENSQRQIFYLCSDGYQDQFGGENDKKYMVKKLKNLLFEISDKSMTEQKQLLEQTFDNWKGNNEQTDDVLVMGVRV